MIRSPALLPCWMRCVASVASVVCVASTAGVAASAHAHFHPAYSHDADIAYRNPAWMAVLDDGLRVSQLSLPGTHDSMSLYGGDLVATQTLPLSIQLEAGIRVFDIRARVTGNRMAIHHGPVFQHAMLGDVLLQMTAFLKRNPSEVVFMRLRQEHTPEEGSRSFEAVLQDYRREFGIEVPVRDNPRLQEVRGQIVILQDFPSRQRQGIRYRRYRIQDNYEVGTIWGLYQKWLDAKIHFKLADTRDDSQLGYINFLSGTGAGAFPYFVASGHSNPATGAPRLATGLTTLVGASRYPDFPRVTCLGQLCSIAYEGTNVLAQQLIRSKPLSYVGMVLADFPGPGLIDSIIELNLAPCQAWQRGERATPGDIYRYANPVSGTTDYFRARHASDYWHFPTDQRSNFDWDFIGHGKVCRDR